MKLDIIYNEDCLEGMKRLPNNFINLIYIDPPFCTQKDKGYKDKWKWNEEIETHFRNIEGYKVIEAFNLLLGKCGLFAYIVYMYIRLKEMRRVLCGNGSIYVHCDYRVNSYLRLILDDIFGKDNFRNEIIWTYSGGTDRAKGFQRKHDTILVYSKAENYIFNPVHVEFSKSTLKRFNKIDEYGRKYKENKLSDGKITKTYMKQEGRLCPDYWYFNIIVKSHDESLAFPTQKPEKLLERIIKASSNEEALIADFFCGSGTTCAVAKKLGRHYLGFEISPEYCEIARKRLKEIQLGLIK